MQNMWDSRFASEEYVYGTEPNNFFKEELLKHAPGKLLLPGEGEGRNAVFAAGMGWDVTAFDSSIAGKEKAERLAAKNKVEITYLLDSYESANFEENSFDMIAFVYTHTNIREHQHKKMLNFLKPGGIIVLEGFSKNQLNYNTGGPGNVDMLYSIDEIKADFKLLSEINVREEEISIEEGQFHSGKASVIKTLGKK